jgi:integrase/recombinase XerD
MKGNYSGYPKSSWRFFMGMQYQHSFENYLFLQRVSPNTSEAYLRAVAGISSFHNQPPAKLNNDQIQDYLLYSIQEKKLSWSSCNVLFCALKKYYQGFLGRDITNFSIPPRPRSKKLPMLLSRQEVQRLLQAPTNIKHRALLATVYSSGLRVSEVVNLQPHHIEADRMMLRVEQGKGRKDRYTVLSKCCLELLRDYWRAFHPEKWMFFGRDKNAPMCIGTAQHIYYQAKAKAKVTKGRGIHTLRHCFASHLLDAGAEIYVIKRCLGHTSIKTTCNYIHLSPDYLSKLTSPLELLTDRGIS